MKIIQGIVLDYMKYWLMIDYLVEIHVHYMHIVSAKYNDR
jgi:hypothetical protein